MQLDDALTQIADIRQRVARAGTFQGYRSVPTALSAGLALLAAAAQERWIHFPQQQMDLYVYLWGGVAVLSMGMILLAMGLRLWRLSSAVQRSLSVTALRQFFPCLIAGAMVSSVILYTHPQVLPGMWMVLFALGVFASRPLLPAPIGWMGAYYLLAGMLTLSGRIDPLSPWTMGVVFGIGQTVLAAMLYWTLERGTDAEVE